MKLAIAIVVLILLIIIYVVVFKASPVDWSSKNLPQLPGTYELTPDHMYAYGDDTDVATKIIVPVITDGTTIIFNRFGKDGSLVDTITDKINDITEYDVRTALMVQRGRVKDYRRNQMHSVRFDIRGTHRLIWGHLVYYKK
jgi:hypothetical protein